MRLNASRMRPLLSKNSLTFYSLLTIDCDHHSMNLGFMVDGSATVQLSGEGNFNKSLEFVANFITSFDNATKPGMVVFSEDPHLVFNFSKYKNPADAIAAVQKATYPGGGRKTGEALNFVRRNLFPESATENNKPNYLIILTSGASYDFVKTPAKLLREENVAIFSIGVGKDYDVDELKLITGDNGTRVYETSFKDLGNLNRMLKKEICRCKLFLFELLLCYVYLNLGTFLFIFFSLAWFVGSILLATRTFEMLR